MLGVGISLRLERYWCV